ncbi:hypothetical protein CCHL11_06782 [Colletotrichum chlorophyti]|uniref:Transcription factor gsfR2 n=1 Tax=Colletotrichum chlorophyti TaxID=708187 RepID=A0A1Q8S9I5_9PEZI|nr:hypothetical protein CCHL11_06782 [Colletotrichum chlorophyti]
MIVDPGSLTTGLWTPPWPDLSLNLLPPDFSSSSAAFDIPQPPPARPPHDGNQAHHRGTSRSQTRTDSVRASIAGGEWFLASSTWRIEHWNPPSREAYPPSVLTNFTRGLQAWVRRWVLDGHSPYIHRSLYADGNRFPACVQDAYLSASLYQHKTPQNEALVYRILDEHVAALLASQPVVAGDGDAASLLETRDHLARVHALHVYTVIRLFDGSVAQRAAAEAQLPTLSLWNKLLWESARTDAETLTRTLGPHASGDCEDPAPSADQRVDARPEGVRDEDPADTYDSDLMTWNLWVLSEAIRRTWIVVTCTLGVYSALKGQWGECAGGTYFTARAGLWDAPSAPRWAAMRRGRGADDSFFVRSGDGEALLRTAAAAEVDEFARHLFTCIWGLDRIEDWALKTASAGEVLLVY